MRHDTLSLIPQHVTRCRILLRLIRIMSLLGNYIMGPHMSVIIDSALLTIIMNLSPPFNIDDILNLDGGSSPSSSDTDMNALDDLWKDATSTSIDDYAETPVQETSTHATPTLSLRGTTMLNFNGYLYVAPRTNKTTKRWRCRTQRCTGSIITAEDYLVKSSFPHTTAMCIPESKQESEKRAARSKLVHNGSDVKTKVLCQQNDVPYSRNLYYARRRQKLKKRTSSTSISSSTTSEDS